jgi:hypothetical protein
MKRASPPVGRWHRRVGRDFQRIMNDWFTRIVSVALALVIVIAIQSAREQLKTEAIDLGRERLVSSEVHRSPPPGALPISARPGPQRPPGVKMEIIRDGMLLEIGDANLQLKFDPRSSSGSVADLDNSELDRYSEFHGWNVHSLVQPSGSSNRISLDPEVVRRILSAVAIATNENRQLISLP